VKTENTERLAKARRYHDVTSGSAPVCFEWGLQNVDGAWFLLLREPHHTDADIEAAKRYLRNNRDVVSMAVERL
jgi:hypothetical protein